MIDLQQPESKTRQGNPDVDCARCRRRDRARRNRNRDTVDLVKSLTRQIRAAGPRVAEGDVEDLAVLFELRGILDSAIATAVAGLRQNGATWADIGALTNTTRQAAQERYGRQVKERGDATSA